MNSPLFKAGDLLKSRELQAGFDYRFIEELSKKQYHIWHVYVYEMQKDKYFFYSKNAGHDDWIDFNKLEEDRFNYIKCASIPGLIGNYDGQIIKFGLTRSYGSRHGAGPFVTEDKNAAHKLNDEHNTFNQWQQNFRAGNLDLITLKYSINNLKGIDYLVINHRDKIEDKNLVCTEYADISGLFYSKGNLIFNPQEKQQFGLTKALFGANPIYEQINKSSLINFIANFLNVNVGILGSGQTHNERKYLLDI